MAQYIDNTNPNGRSASPVLAVVLVIALILLALLVLPRLFMSDADTTVNVTDTNTPSSMQSDTMPRGGSSDTNPVMVPVSNTTINSTTTTTTGTSTR